MVITLQIICRLITHHRYIHFLYFFLFSVSSACLEAREHFEQCKIGYGKLSKLIPPGQYYRYCDHWHYLNQRVVFLIALTIYLEKGILVSAETVSDILECMI